MIKKSLRAYITSLKSVFSKTGRRSATVTFFTESAFVPFVLGILTLVLSYAAYSVIEVTLKSTESWKEHCIQEGVLGASPNLEYLLAIKVSVKDNSKF